MQDENASDFILDQVALYCNAQAISLDPMHSLWDTMTYLKSVSTNNVIITRFGLTFFYRILLIYLVATNQKE